MAKEPELESMGRTEQTPAGEEFVVDMPLDDEPAAGEAAAANFARLSMPNDMSPQELGMLSAQLRSMADGFRDLAKASRRTHRE